MSVLEDTGRGYPLPHPDNNPRSVDVPRLRQALNLIDEDMTALAGSLDGKADASGVTAEISAAISALLAGAPEAYDTLVEIADKLASDDDVIAGILTSIAAKANIVDVFTRNEMEGALAAKAPLNSPEFVNKVTLPNGRVIDETSLPFEALVRVQRSANTQLIFGNVGSLIDCTGTFTQTFGEPAALKNGWWCYVRNSGSGDITIPASDGRTNWIMYPGEMRLFQCDGTALRSIVIQPFSKVFGTSGNFIKPPGYLFFELFLLGGGGGGGGASGPSTGGPSHFTGGAGGMGGCGQNPSVPESQFAETNSLTIGAAGLPGESKYDATPGTDGGSTALVMATKTIAAGGGKGGPARIYNNVASGATGVISSELLPSIPLQSYFGEGYSTGGGPGLSGYSFSGTVEPPQQPTGGQPGIARIRGVI